MIEGMPPDGHGRLFIAGEWRAPAAGGYRPVIDPSTGSTIGQAPIASVDEARAAVEAAAATEESWAAVTGHQRARILREIAQRIRADRDPLARLIALEVGKPIAEARVEVTRAASVFELAAEEIRLLGGESYPADAYEYPAGNDSRFLFTVRDPMGVVVAIGPFNFPLNLLCHKVAPALAAGNPVVAKPTSSAPFTALRLAQHLQASGIPPGVFNVVLGPGGAIGSTLVEHPRTRLVTFTGSTEVGKQLAEAAGRHAKRVILELGGLDPFIVLDDAPLDVAVAAAARGAFGYSGQVCTASKRFLVQEAVADRFGAALATRAEGLRLGPASEETTELGPLIDRAAVDRVERMVEDALHRDAAVLAGGRRSNAFPGGYFFEATVLDSVPEGAEVVRQEPFGPIAPILRFEKVEDAVRIANATPYGLQASVYTRDFARAFRVAKQIRAGSVHLNDPTNLRWDALPFGGVKESGLGREGIRDAMLEMTEVKLISVNYADG
ncbi:MAG: aldehyde dehydrogenase [Thermoplasmata archaeon]|nr:aldehyde dehydrogenase [Thermoplasmata archaeon]